MRGLRIALTGGLDGLSRAAFKAMLVEVGAVFTANLDAQTDQLVVGTEPLGSKLAEAEELGIPMVDGATFLARLLVPQVPVADVVAPVLPSVELGSRTVRLLDLELPRRPRGAQTPSTESFRGYTLDAPTVEVLRGLARAVLLRHPVLAVGSTATSKSSAIRYLAALTGAQVARLNLNGQTDTAELIGRYVPDGSGWRFAEGLVPLAMRNGWWLVLDEVNLAEPAVIERLNPVLEREPTLVLTEGPGTRFGVGGEVAVHPEFRVFATMNPPTYVGRSTLSAAWRDRFVGQILAREPGEPEVLQLLEHLTSGVQPSIEVGGVTWGPGPSWSEPEPALAPLAPLWPRVATFFAGLTTMSSGPEGLGASTREQPVFTRRGVLAVVDALLGLHRFDPVRGRLDLSTAPREMLAEALRAVSVERLVDPADRQRVEDLLASLDL